ncbi:MAG TPA: hypothetical protein VKY32_03960 [Flavobacterium sp.]|nr:hypothetical protein [Flavobacterium sp.]
MKKVFHLFSVITLVCIVSSTCQSQTNILADSINIQPTHYISNPYLDEALNIIIKKKNFENWRNSPNKMLLISSKTKDDQIQIRAILGFKKHFYISKDTDNYSAYFSYKDIFIVYWGDEKLFLTPTGNKIDKHLFENSKKERKQTHTEDGIEIIVLNNPEYFGCEFVIKNHELHLIEINYFGDIVIE